MSQQSSPQNPGTQPTKLAELGGWPALFGALSSGAGASGSDQPEAMTALLVAGLTEILSGQASEGQIGAFAVGLATRGERPEEIAALVEVMLAHAVPLDLGDQAGAAVDIVGTGGAKTGQPAMNVSTMASLVAAACGVPICKHGNRKASSTSGSTDVLEELGIAVELDAAGVAGCVREAGVGFAFARAFHPAMRHAGPVRAQLGVPTVFNLLGPLSNPAHVQRMVLGVSDAGRARLMIDALAARGLPRAMVVSGLDGLDEFTLNGPTQVFELRDATITEAQFNPTEVGLSEAGPTDISGGDPAHNASLARSILGGETVGARRDIVVLNAAAALVVGDVASTMVEGVERADAAISSGEAAEVLTRLVDVSNRLAGAS